jgi:lysophospholipase L1-like esterase
MAIFSKEADMAKLVAIGDSLTQGFQSGAISRTEDSFPAMIARTMGLEVPAEFKVPCFPQPGLPFNIELMLKWMESRLEADISLEEWWFRFPSLFYKFLEQVEDVYERGPGAQPSTFAGVYHNLAIWGYRVQDSYTVSSAYAQRVINKKEGWIKDDVVPGLPSAPMYRTAQRVLNPNRQPEREGWTQLDNLQRIVDEEGELENLILWLGNNDCLGAVTCLEIKNMDRSDTSVDPEVRRRWNLTHPQVFRNDYKTLVARIKEIIPAKTRVFVGTIGHVTIPPLTQGVGEFWDGYYDYYSRFYINDSNFAFMWPNRYLTRAQAMFIDGRIDTFNTIIRAIVAQQGPNWHVVDTGQMLDTLAVKRNRRQYNPDCALYEYYARRGPKDHPLLNLRPIPNVLRLGTINGQRHTGGLFSLDGIHPTTIGYGMIAEEFLRVMRRAGVREADPARLDWAQLMAQDTLIQRPPLLWDDVMLAAENHPLLWNMIFSVM